MAAAAKEPSFQRVPFHPIEDKIGLAWLWMDQAQEDGGPYFHGSEMYIPIPEALTSADMAQVQIPEETPQWMTLSLKMMSCNVNSFKDLKKNATSTWSARAELIKQQAIDTRAQVLAWQETRRAKGGTWQDARFFAFEQPATQGRGGVALWFRKDIPIIKGNKSYFLEANLCKVVHATSEMMVVKYVSDVWKAVFVTAHAPTDVSEKKDKDHFWMELEKVLSPYTTWDILVGIDANGRVGDDALPHIGSFAADLPNDNGYRLMHLLQRCNLALPATFQEYVTNRQEVQGTWLAKNGWKRIDFLCIPLTWLQTTWPCTGVLSIEKEVEDDHRAVWVAIKRHFVSSGKQKTVQHRKLQVCSQAMLSAEGRQKCRRILQEIRHDQPDWSCAADVQANYLQDTAERLLQQTFPRERRVHKPSWIQDDTWTTIAQTRKARHHLQRLKQQFTTGVMAAIFQTWKTRQPLKAGQYQAWIKQHDVATAQHLHQLRMSRAKRAKCLQDDQAAHLSQLAAQQFDDLSEAKGTELWKKLRFQLPKFRNKQKKPVPHQQAHDQFLTHFANIEDAAIVSISDLEVKSHDCSGKGIQAAIRIEMTAVDLPSIFELEDAIRAVASKKSSLGSFPIELMKADPSAAAEILLPLMMDFFRHFQQPITWKGGSYYPLFKGKGNYSIPNNYRAILIAYAVPKLFHRIVRARLAQTVAPQLMPFQIGGVKRMSVHFAVQFLNALRLRADILKKPSAVIFFDLRSAFYRAQRSTIVGDVLQYGRADDEDITLDQLNRKPALEDMGVPLPLQAAVQEIFTNSWNTVIASGQERNDHVMESQRGTRPGDPIADLAFTCIMRSVLKQFMEQADNILPSLAVDELTQPVPAITWVDDVAIFLQADTVEALVEKATEAVKLMHQKCRSHGLDLNYAKGKTEIMFKFHGKDAVQWRKKLHLQPTMDLGSGYWSSIEVPITTKYTHLGVVHSAKATHDAELNYRLGRARAAMQECMKPVLRQRAIPAQTRWQLAKSLILSRLFFAAELWPTLSASQAAKVYNFMMKIARIILNMENFVGMDHYTDQHVEAHIQIPALATLLRAARLRHLARMWHLGPDALRRLLLQLEMVDGDAWMRRAWEDVAWLQQRVPNLRHMPDPLVDRHQWVIRMGSFKEWYSMIGQAVQADTQYRHYMAKHQLWKGRLQQQLEHVGLKFEMQQPEPEFQPHQCNLCEAKFATYKALSVHMYKQHQQHARERQYMEGTVCLSCLKEFHSTQRLRQHLQWKPDGCLRHLQETLWPFPHNDVPIKEMLRTAHRVPTFRLEGPEMPSRQAWIEAKPDKEFPPLPEAIPEPPGPRPQHEDEHEAPSQSTAEMVEDGKLALLVEAALTEKATWEPPLVHWWSTAPAFATLKEFATILQDDLVHRVDFTWYYDIFQWVETTLAEHFSIRRMPMDCEEPARNAHAHYRKQSPSTDPKVSYNYTHVERALPGTAATHYILYAYAGHRREGDMVEWAEKFSAQTGLQIAVVTLDIVYHNQLCNLRNPDAQSKWCKHMEERRFIAAIGAPPCETWSVARMQAWILQDGGSPPLRTRQEPWGLAELSAKQQAQVTTWCISGCSFLCWR